MNKNQLDSLIRFQRLIREKKQVNDQYIKNIIDFPYPLDEFQLESIKSIERGQHVLVTAHTSAGKSTVAEYAIAKCAKQNQKVIYTSPIKTLSNQKYYDLKEKCSTILKMNSSDIGLMTGDVKINPENAQCVIMTTEILRNKLYKDLKYFDDVGIIIFDEVHYIKDNDRGHVWEESIIMIPKNITLVMLSATISNPQEFAYWVEKIKDKKTNLVSTLYRPVPLNFYLFAKLNKNDNNQIHSLVTNEKKIDYKNYELVKDHYQKYFKDKYSYKALFNYICEYIHNNQMTPAILFSFSRKNCEVYSKYITTNLINHNERFEIEKIFNFYTSRNLSENDRHLPQTILIKDNLLKGIGIHHSGLLPILKEIVEILFGKGLIKLLFATETFAVGVNMPAKTVIFTELEKFDNHGKRNLFTDEFLQMSGRAGRRGLDKKGYVIYLPIKPMLEKNELNSIILGNTPKLLSKFVLDYRMILKSIDSDEQDTFTIINDSLLNIETKKIIKLNYNEINEIKNDMEKIILNLSNSENNILYEYLEEEKDRKKIKKKKHKLELIKNKWTNKDINFDLVLEKVKGKKDLEYQIEYLKEQNILLENSACNEVFKTLKYLFELGYIKYDVKLKVNYYNCKYLIKTLNTSNLTSTGLIACQINECNGLLLSQILTKNIFESCSEIDIVCILSLFINDGQKTEEEYLSDKIISRHLKDKIKNLISINDYLYSMSKSHDIYYDFDFNYSFIDYAYLWSSGKDLREIYKTIYDIYNDSNNKIYEGNFIKNILKISNMVKEIIDSLAIINNYELIDKFSRIDKLLIRGIIANTSIYLS